MNKTDRLSETYNAPGSKEWHRLRDLFADVQEMPEEERAVFLDKALAGEPALRAELDSLLRSARTAGAFLAPRRDVCE